MSAANPNPQPQPLTAPPGLDTPTLAGLVHDLLDTLPIAPGTDPHEVALLQQAAVTKALDLRPRNPSEATLAIHVVMSDRASTDCYRRAILPDLPHAVVLSYHARAASLARLSGAQAVALQALQRMPAPPVLRAGSAAALIVAVSRLVPAQAAADAPQDPMHREAPAPAPLPAAAADAGKDPMHREAPAPRPAAAADAGKDPMHREAPAPLPAAAADAGKDPMHREAPAPLPAAADAGNDPMHREAPAPRPAATANPANDPMHRGAPMPRPAAGANGTKYAMPGGTAAQRPHSAIELPPTPEQLYSARIADDVLRTAREAALARSS